MYDQEILNKAGDKKNVVLLPEFSCYIRRHIFATRLCEASVNMKVIRDILGYADKGAGAKRGRYSGSLIDANSLIPGENVENLPETFAIFITEQDVLGDNKPIYHINRCISETGKMYWDGSHILYVNAECRDDALLGRLMSDFSCTNPADMLYTELSERVRNFKEVGDCKPVLQSPKG